MSDELTLATQGLEAWRRGDIGLVAEMLDSAATWRATEPGEWDCESPEAIVGTLRERHEQGFGRGRIELHDAGQGRIVAVSWPQEIGGEEWPDETATVISFRGSKIVSMQDYRTREEALAAVGQG